jgi:hypothetical protein
MKIQAAQTARRFRVVALISGKVSQSVATAIFVKKCPVQAEVAYPNTDPEIKTRLKV